MHWSDEPIKPHEPLFYDARPYLRARPLPQSTEASAVHSTSLALQVLLMNYQMDDASDVMSWIQKMRCKDYVWPGTRVGILCFVCG